MANKLILKKLPPVEVINSDMIIVVETGDDKLGELHISKGSSDFYKKAQRKSTTGSLGTN